MYKSSSTFSIYPVIEESVLPYGYSQGSLIDALSAYSQKTDRTRATPRTPRPPSAATARTGGAAVAVAAATLASQPRFGIGLDDSMCLSVSHAWTTLKRQSSAGRYTATDRSSVSSGVSVDDFDREASAKMQLLFDDIDSVLFERQDTVQQMAGDIYQECRHWNFAFPHLRVLGQQLVASRETGFEIIPAPSSAAATTAAAAAGPHQAFGAGLQTGSSVARLRSEHAFISHTGGDSTPGTGHGRLTVEGVPISTVPPLDKVPGISSDDVLRLAEEVIEQDGCYEEIIAVDDGCTEPNCRAQEPTHGGYGSTIECSLHAADRLLHPAAAAAVAAQRQQQRRRSTRYPPITPAACAKDSVDEAAFDALWQAVTTTLRPLLLRYAQTFALLPLAVSEHDRSLVLGVGGGASSSPAALHYDLLQYQRHRRGGNDDAHRLPMIHSQPSSRADRAGSAAAFAASMAARLSSMQMSPAMPLSRQRWSSGGGGSSSSGHAVVWHGNLQGAATVAAAGSGSGEMESRARLGSILTISKKEMQARDRHGDELDGSSVRADSSMRLDHPFAMHQDSRRESAGGSGSSGGAGHVAAIVAHMNALAAVGPAKKGGSGGNIGAGSGGGGGSSSSSATAAALSIIAAGNRRSRLTPLPDRSLTPYADEAGMPNGSVAVSLQRLLMTGKKIASPLLSSTAAAGSIGAVLPLSSRVGGSMLPPIVNQVIEPQGFETSGIVMDSGSILPTGFKSPTPPLSSFSAARPTIRRRFTDRIGSALAVSDKVAQQHQHSPAPSLQQGLRDKHAATTVSTAAAAAGATAITTQRPSTTHGLSGARVNIQFAGSSSRVPFTPIGISPLAKAGSLHNVTYRRGNKVLNPFAR